eukprot:CAMPEP_0170072866 /NCGR_PEP_ID=MMETSP0019_2-20121128/10408_1 /TAXON_ID=98059 /ORGANISM="Dinobryon sp., Strain UTEXLB2267" /LENGTH=179 /DNA_ID=CAMNT_0010282073 /DNA_START=41 /DNA_END=580 /DNA_ORIENTATION=+
MALEEALRKLRPFNFENLPLDRNDGIWAELRSPPYSLDLEELSALKNARCTPAVQPDIVQAEIAELRREFRSSQAQPGGESEGERVSKINRGSVYIVTIGFVIATVLFGVLFGIAINFGLSGFVSILKGIQLGVDKIPSHFDIVGRKVASICRWEGDIFSHMVFGAKNCTESYPDNFFE